jgi:hypothetical protein
LKLNRCSPGNLHAQIRIAKYSACAMPELDGLATELLAHIAFFLGPLPSQDRNVAYCCEELLSFRCASRACEEAVRRAATEHRTCEYIRFWTDVSDPTSDPAPSVERIQALGRVFGSGCREVDHHVRGGAETPAAVVNALRHFVVGPTQGRLLRLTIADPAIPAAVIMEMVRASPRLESFLVWSAESLAGVNLHDFASDVSRACPSLKSVRLPLIEGVSPAESYEHHFPGIRHLDFSYTTPPVTGFGYEPTRYDRIEATVRRCASADSAQFFRNHVSPDLVTRLLGTPLRERLTYLRLSGYNDVSPETILQCALGFEALDDLALPSNFSGSPEFYAALARARPTLKKLHPWNADDACMRVICEDFALVGIYLSNENMSPAIVDMILLSPSAYVLEDFQCNLDLTSADVLRLVRGCPRLANVGWRNRHTRSSSWLRLSPIIDGSNVDEINALMKARGSRWGELWEPFPEYGPNYKDSDNDVAEATESSSDSDASRSDNDAVDSDSVRPAAIEDSSSEDSDSENDNDEGAGPGQYWWEIEPQNRDRTVSDVDASTRMRQVLKALCHPHYV